MSDLPLKATLKAGGDFASPWLTVDANDPNDLALKLKGLIEHESALQLVVEAANVLKAINSAAPILAPVADAPPISQPAPQQPAQQGWGVANRPSDGGSQGPTSSYQNSSHQTPAAQQQHAAPVQNGPKLHPTDTCAVCGQRPQEKDVFRKSDNKKFEFWTCPNQRSRDDGHYSAFRN